MKIPKISVILTIYNSKDRLEEVIDSIKNQEGNSNIFELELLVIDDCSTDGSADFLREYNIDFISTEINSGGPNKGRNIGLRRCTGDYICFADHDDIWLPNKLLSQLSLSHLAPIITSGYILMDSINNREIERKNVTSNKDLSKFYNKNITFKDKLSKYTRGQNMYLGSIMFSSEFKHIYFEEKYGMLDFDWVLRLLFNQRSVEYCNPLYKRFVKRKNLSMNENYRIKDYTFAIETIQQYKNQYLSYVRLGHKRINGSIARYYYLINNMKKARKYFLKSEKNIKTLLYLITTFVGSRFVKKYFNVFG